MNAALLVVLCQQSSAANDEYVLTQVLWQLAHKEKSHDAALPLTMCPLPPPPPKPRPLPTLATEETTSHVHEISNEKLKAAFKVTGRLLLNDATNQTAA